MAILEVEAAVSLPFASTVKVGTTEAEPYESAVTPVEASVSAPPAATVASPESVTKVGMPEPFA
jgi:hypothetical protein